MNPFYFGFGPNDNRNMFMSMMNNFINYRYNNNLNNINSVNNPKMNSMLMNNNMMNPMLMNIIRWE